jgi:hypothetical protein
VRGAQYGSLVPDSVLDKIEEETAREIRRQKESLQPGSESFDMDSEEIRIFPDFSGSFHGHEEDEEVGLGSIIESWLHRFFVFVHSML